MPPKPPAPLCGDGIVGSNEQCDDGDVGGADDGCKTCVFSCPNGWANVGGHCYGLTSLQWPPGAIYEETKDDGPADFVRADWATEPCGSNNGVATHLALIESAEESLYLGASLGFANVIASIATDNPPWVAAGAGFATPLSSAEKSSWFQSEGGAVPPGLWAASSPRAGEHCALIGADGKLASAGCFSDPGSPPVARRALCEREVACALQKPDKKTIAVGYQGSNGHCYARLDLAGGTRATQESAAGLCKAYGAHLASFETAQELEKLTGAGLTSGDVWVAAERQACAGGAFVWKTTNELLPAGSPLWDDKQPTPPGDGATCAVMGRNRRLSSSSCVVEQGVLCERDF